MPQSLCRRVLRDSAPPLPVAPYCCRAIPPPSRRAISGHPERMCPAIVNLPQHRIGGYGYHDEREQRISAFRVRPFVVQTCNGEETAVGTLYIVWAAQTALVVMRLENPVTGMMQRRCRHNLRHGHEVKRCSACAFLYICSLSYRSFSVRVAEWGTSPQRMT